MAWRDATSLALCRERERERVSTAYCNYTFVFGERVNHMESQFEETLASCKEGEYADSPCRFYEKLAISLVSGETQTTRIFIEERRRYEAQISSIRDTFNRGMEAMPGHSTAALQQRDTSMDDLFGWDAPAAPAVNEAACTNIALFITFNLRHSLNLIPLHVVYLAATVPDYVFVICLIGNHCPVAVLVGFRLAAESQKNLHAELTRTGDRRIGVPCSMWCDSGKLGDMFKPIDGSLSGYQFFPVDLLPAKCKPGVISRHALNADQMFTF